MADAAAAAVDLILAKRAWAVVARDNDHDNNGEGGDHPALSLKSCEKKPLVLGKNFVRLASIAVGDHWSF